MGNYSAHLQIQWKCQYLTYCKSKQIQRKITEVSLECVNSILKERRTQKSIHMYIHYNIFLPIKGQPMLPSGRSASEFLSTRAPGQKKARGSRSTLAASKRKATASAAMRGRCCIMVVPKREARWIMLIICSDRCVLSVGRSKEEVGLLRRDFVTVGWHATPPLMLGMGMNAADSDHARRWAIAIKKEAGFIVWLRRWYMFRAVTVLSTETMILSWISSELKTKDSLQLEQDQTQDQTRRSPGSGKTAGDWASHTVVRDMTTTTTTTSTILYLEDPWASHAWLSTFHSS